MAVTQREGQVSCHSGSPAGQLASQQGAVCQFELLGDLSAVGCGRSEGPDLKLTGSPPVILRALTLQGPADGPQPVFSGCDLWGAR